MTRLRQSDLLALLDFVHEATALVGGDDVFPPPILERLARLVPCDIVSYCELDRMRRRVLRSTDFPRVENPPDWEQVFWRIVDEHPLCLYQARTGDFSAVKLSDFITRRQLHGLEIYVDWFGPWGIEHELEVGIPSPLVHTKTFHFDRGAGRDFSERERLVLNLLQPHLARLYELAELKRRLEGDNAELGDGLPLTVREREILEYVRAGKTNAEIARILWIAPSTVRKHLENVYEKLGVGTRTAAVARAFPAVAD
jgi:DNA-binding CsgD family transcriptional regulator